MINTTLNHRFGLKLLAVLLAVFVALAVMTMDVRAADPDPEDYEDAQSEYYGELPDADDVTPVYVDGLAGGIMAISGDLSFEEEEEAANGYADIQPISGEVNENINPNTGRSPTEQASGGVSSTTLGISIFLGLVVSAAILRRTSSDK